MSAAGGTALSLEFLETLRKRITATYRADLATVDRFARLLGEDKLENDDAVRTARSGASHAEIVESVLSTEPDRSWTVAEIAELTGLSPSAIRVVTYASQHKEKFICVADGERRERRWRLRTGENIAV